MKPWFAFLVVHLCALFLSSAARGDLSTIGWWRLGEADPGATAGTQAQNPTVASTGPFPLSWDSGTDGKAFYRSEVVPAKRLRLGASTLALGIINDVSYPGYHTASVPTSAVSDVGLEIWAKAGQSTVDGADPSDIVIWNGQENGWGYGIVQQSGQWVGAIRASQVGSPFTPVASAPLTPGVWTHLALVESGGTWRFLVNTRLTGSLSATAVAPDFRFNVGESYNVLDKGFGGQLDEARIFTFAPGAFSVSDLNYVALPPVLNRTNPRRIPLKAGSRVSVTGANLLTTKSATLSKRPVAKLQRVSDTTLRFRVPKGIKSTLRKVPLVVTNDDGKATKVLKTKVLK